jgi:hypothetical protein
VLEQEEGAPVPFALWVSRLCEEFSCLPSAALREWEAWQETDQPDLLEEIIEARAYAAAKRASDDAETPEARQRLPKTWLFGMVTEIEMQLAREAIARREQEERDRGAAAEAGSG